MPPQLEQAATDSGNPWSPLVQLEREVAPSRAGESVYLSGTKGRHSLPPLGGPR